MVRFRLRFSFRLTLGLDSKSFLDTTVTVIEKTEDGWWLVTSDAGKTQGWISAAFLNTKNAVEDAPEFVDVDDEKYVVSGK